MKTRTLLLSLLIPSILLIAACSSPVEPTEVVEPSAEEMMEDDEMMEEEAMDEEAMMDDEMAEDEMMDDEMVDEVTTFVIRIENIADEGGLTILAPGAFELNDHPVSFFNAGEADRGQGLEGLAEDGDPNFLVGTVNEMMEGDMMGFAIEAFNTPTGADAPGPAGPGTAYEFVVEAHPGQYLTFATMFVQSNDWFFAPDEDSIELFDADGNPISGDITSQIYLWDAGTEVNQVPGEGSDQAPRQAGPNSGEAEGGLVSLVEDFTDYQILVTITTQG
jgi:hypothetical protein